MYKHKIPVHLEQEEIFVWGMTGRQILLVGCGVVLGYMFFTDLINALPSIWGLVLASACAGITVVLFTVAAFVRILGRGVEQWTVVGLLYLFTPHLYLWGPLDEESDDVPPQEHTLQEKALVMEQEEIGTQW